MPICAICGNAITPENDSQEHLIPNAIGGRRKVPGFICMGCNSTAGMVWDSELARELNWMSLQFGISRERGDSPQERIEATGGGQYVYQPDGRLKLQRPVFKKTPIGEGLEISITARDNNEARRMLKQLKKKYPQIDVEAAMADATQKFEYLKDLLHIGLRFGNELSGRSMAKTVLALAVSSGVEAIKCEVACDYLRTPTATGRWELFYETDLIVDRPDGVPLHCVSITGTKGKLVGYVEYFGYRRVWMPLSDQYTGPDIQAAYILDPVSGKELPLSVRPVPPAVGDMPIDNRNQVIIQAITRVLDPMVKAAQDRERDRVILDAWNTACRNLGIKDGDPISPSQRIQLAQAIPQLMRPYIEHLLHNPFKDFKPKLHSQSETTSTSSDVK